MERRELVKPLCCGRGDAVRQPADILPHDVQDSSTDEAVFNGAGEQKRTSVLYQRANDVGAPTFIDVMWRLEAPCHSGMCQSKSFCWSIESCISNNTNCVTILNLFSYIKISLDSILVFQFNTTSNYNYPSRNLFESYDFSLFIPYKTTICWGDIKLYFVLIILLLYNKTSKQTNYSFARRMVQKNLKRVKPFCEATIRTSLY